MKAAIPILAASLFVFCCFFVDASNGGDVIFSSLPETLLVSASPKSGQVLKAGEDNITVTWGPNRTNDTVSLSYKYIEVKLCYAPISQVDRPWRKTSDILRKDKSCQFQIVSKPYANSGPKSESFQWVIEKRIPGASYFIRAYAFDSSGKEIAFGQTTNSKITDNVFEIKGISGADWKIKVASATMAVFPLVSLLVLLVQEKKR